MADSSSGAGTGGADGSIVIDTSLDQSGFEKGTEKLLAAIKEVTAQVKTSGEAIQQTIAGISPKFDELTSALDVMSDNMSQVFARLVPAIENFKLQAAQAGQVVQTTATQTEGAVRQVSAAGTAAAQTAQQNYATASAGTASYDKALQRVQKQIDKTEAALAPYYTELQNIHALTDEVLESSESQSQVEAALGIEQKMIADLNAKYKTQLSTLEALNTEKEKILGQRAAAIESGSGNADVKALVKDISAASKKVDGYAAKVDKMSTLGANDKAWAAVGYDIDAAIEKVESYRGRLEDLHATGQIGSDTYSSISAQLDGLTSRLSATSAQLPQAMSGWQRFGQILKSVGSAALHVAGALSKLAFRAVTAGVKHAVKSLKDFCLQSKKTVLSSNKLVKTLTSLKTLLRTRIKRMFIGAIFRGVQEAIQTLAKFSSEFDAAMSNIRNRSKELSGNLAVSLGALVQKIEPVLSMIISGISRAMTYLNAFFSMLAGKSTMIVAKKQTGSYADSLKKAAGAAKDLKAQVYGFDELNKRSDDKKGGGAADGSDLFEEVAIGKMLSKDVADRLQALKDAVSAGDWRTVGSQVAEGLNSIMGVIDGFINGRLRPAGVAWAARIAEIGNGLVEAFNWGRLGRTIADGINAIADIINTLLTTFDFEAAGVGVATTINNLFAGVDWNLLGTAFANKWNALVDFIYGIVTTTDWASIGASLAAFIDNWAAAFDVRKLGQTIARGINGVKDLLLSFVSSIDWLQMGIDMGTAFSDMLAAIDWAGAVTTLTLGLNALINVFTGFVSSIDWAQLGADIGAAIASLFGTIDWAGLGSMLNGLVGGLLDGLIGFIGDTDWGKVIADVVSGILTLLDHIDLLGILAKLSALIMEIVVQLPGIFVDAVGSIVDSIGEAFTGIGLDCIGGFFSGIGQGLKNLGQWLKAHLVDPVVNGVKSLFGIHSPSTVFAEIGGFLIAGMLEGISGSWSKLLGFFQTNLESLKSYISTAWDNVKQTAVSKWTDINATVSDKWSRLKDDLSQTDWSSIGTNLVTGLKSGISRAWSGLKSTVSDLASRLTSGLKTAFDIHSPSRVWANIGELLDEGLVVGLDNGRRDVLSTATGLASDMSATFGGINPTAQMRMPGGMSGELSGIADKLSAIATIFGDISRSLDGVGIRVPDIAAGRAVPYLARISTGAEDIEKNGLQGAEADERLFDISLLLKQVVEILQRKKDLSAAELSSLLTMSQLNALRGYGG